MADFSVTNHGTIVMVQPVSEAAQAWVDDNVEVPDWAWMGPSFGVDHRMFPNLLAGILEEGFKVGDDA